MLELSAQHGKHGRVGFDRNNVDTQEIQYASELAGARAQIEYSLPGRGLQCPAHSVVRIVGTVYGVGGGSRPEG